MQQKIIIGTRGSKLALWQAEFIAGQIRTHHPHLQTELKIIKTSGDKILDVPLAKIGGKALFVKEIEQELLEGQADLAVHSMKDVPSELPDGLHLGVIPKRDDYSDCFLSQYYPDIFSLPPEARIGTSSLRRQAQLLHSRPDLKVESLRGNLDTRVRKLTEDNFEAIVVSCAGLKRLQLQARYMNRLEPPEFLPAVGQGAYGLEYRKDNTFVHEIVKALDHQASGYELTVERSFLHRLQAGCQVPVGGLAVMEESDTLGFQAFVSDLQGRRMIRRQDRSSVQDAEGLGKRVAERILEAGGRQILQEIYGETIF